MQAYLVPTIVVLIIFASALVGNSRGLMRETLAVANWVVATVAAYYFHPFVPAFPDLQTWTDKMGFVASALTVFLVVLVITSNVSIRIADRILDSRVSAVDRSFGFVFGAVRGYLLAAFAFALLTFLISVQYQPGWLRQDRTLEPLRSAIAHAITELACLCVVDRQSAAAAPGNQIEAKRPASTPEIIKPEARKDSTAVSFIALGGIVAVLWGLLL